MRVNNRDFTLYNIDSNESIVQRIADDMGVPPFWVYVDGDLNDDNANVKAENILDTLKTNVTQVESFSELQEKLSLWLNSRDFDETESIKKLAEMFVITYYDVKRSQGLDRRMIVVELENFFLGTFETEFTYDDIERTLDNSDVIKLALSNAIAQNSFRVKKIKKSAQAERRLDFEDDDNNEYDDDKKNVTTENVNFEKTNYIVHSLATKFVLKFNRKIILRHIFNQIEFKQYDLFDNFEPMFCSYDKLFRVNKNTKQFIHQYNFDYEHNTLNIVFVKLINNSPVFRDVEIKMESDSDMNTCSVYADIDKESGFNSRFLFSLFPEYFVGEIISERVDNIKCSFTILRTSIVKELFLDCIMNNPKFFSLVVNERLKFSKFNKMRIYYIGRNFVPFSFVLSNVGQNVEVRINKAPSYDVLHKFISHFMTMFVVYKLGENKLYKMYKKYAPTMVEPTLFKNFDEYDVVALNSDGSVKKDAVNDLRLKQTVPSLFVSQYSRRCAHRPKIVDTVPTNMPYIEFPLYGEGGLKPLTYVCDRDDGFVYPGLRKNKLANNQTFKYIPCCYETNQLTRNTSGLNEYLRQNNVDADGGGGTELGKQKYEQSSFRTNRISEHNSTGRLPVNLNKFFSTHKLRIGVYKSPNSFLDVVSRGCKKYLDFLDNPMMREEFLERLRSNMDYRLSMQENVDIGAENAKVWLANTKLYLEPHRFFRCVEEFFKCNVYIFERSPDRVVYFNANTAQFVWKKTSSPSGVLQIPNAPSVGVYADSKRFNNSVGVYVHMGATTNLLQYPHCELISLDETETDDVEKLYRNLLVVSVKKALDEKNIAEQYQDEFGRIISVLTKNGDLVKLERPVAPIASGPLLKPIAQNSEQLDNNPSTSLLLQNVYVKQFARILLEYCMIKYALSETNSVEEFANRYFRVDENVSYPTHFDNRYEIYDYDKIFMRNNEIIVESEDTVERLAYNMQKLEKRNGLAVYRRSFITSYFDSLLDYEPIVVNEETFKQNYESVSGVFMNNELFDIEDTNSVLYKDNARTELNGVYQVYPSISDMIMETMLADFETIGTDGDPDVYFIWNASKFDELWTQTNSRGRTVIVFVANNTTKVLMKISHLKQ